MSKKTKIAVLGAGQFGFYISNFLGDSGFENVYLNDIDESVIIALKNSRRHPKQFEKLDVVLSKNVKPTFDLEECISDAEIVFAAVPAQIMRDAIKNAKPYLKSGVILINVAKALELETSKRMDEVFKDELEGLDYNIAALAGAMIAAEGVKGDPLSAEIACNDENIANYLKDLFGNYKLRLEPTTDLIGVELAGALKNVYAIAGGICYQMYGASSTSTLLSKCSKEGGRFAIEYGAYGETFKTGSLAWLADLAVTFSTGRNSIFGRKIIELGSVDNALNFMKEENYTIEGYATTQVADELARRYEGNYPIIRLTHRVLYEGKDPKKEGKLLMRLKLN